LSRFSLLHLLPDFSDSVPVLATRRDPGFEPLVRDALERNVFSSIHVPNGFAGLAADSYIVDDPFEDFENPLMMEPETDILSAVDGGEDPSFATDLHDLNLPAAALGPDSLVGDTAFEDDGIAVNELLEASHREEIDRLETAHREALDNFLSTAISKAKDEVIDTIASELAMLLAERIRADIVEDTMGALTDAVRAIVEDTGAIGFELRGPENLILDFQARWPSDGARITTVAADIPDLVVRIEKSVISTRLAEVDQIVQEAVS
jgi:hypothetical protein